MKEFYSEKLNVFSFDSKTGGYEELLIIIQESKILENVIVP